MTVFVGEMSILTDCIAVRQRTNKIRKLNIGLPMLAINAVH